MFLHEFFTSRASSFCTLAQQHQTTVAVVLAITVGIGVAGVCLPGNTAQRLRHGAWTAACAVVAVLVALGDFSAMRVFLVALGYTSLALLLVMVPIAVHMRHRHGSELDRQIEIERQRLRLPIRAR